MPIYVHISINHIKVPKAILSYIHINYRYYQTMYSNFVPQYLSKSNIDLPIQLNIINEITI